ncbi:hypothetical protein GUJ93_ZPchr0001g32609 [Zizania palustris]|uniref:MADS-box domain-containing protein n=1 Tax=Zizania palustris TaxID=103762 RepID=A0A8J5SBJ4_ZIZPA|nr:hypothetical protein GUJ93_ZPchr0001g32609 [Zizania palustris]
MPRTKLVLKLIESEKKRKATYKNRRDGLVQKVSQFATLCGVDAFVICLGPAAAGGEVTTWPPDRRAVLELIARLRALPPEKIRQVQNTPTLLREDLAKQQRALLKVRQCGADEVLAPWDCRFDELSLDGLNALHDKLADALERTQRRMAALHGHVNDNASASTTALAVLAPAPHALALPENTFVDFPFGMFNAGPVGSHYYYPPHDTQPQSVSSQPPCLSYQIPPPCLPYQMPPLPFPAPPDLGTTAPSFMDSNPYATNAMHCGATAAPVFFDDHELSQSQSQSFAIATVSAGYDDYYYGAHGFSYTSGPAGYDLEPGTTSSDVWPSNAFSNPTDGVSFQLQNDMKGLLPGSSRGSGSLQGGFQV